MTENTTENTPNQPDEKPDLIEVALGSAIEGVDLAAAAFEACDPAVKKTLELCAGWVTQYEAIKHSRDIELGKTVKALLEMGVPESIVEAWYAPKNVPGKADRDESSSTTVFLASALSAMMPRIMELFNPSPAVGSPPGVACEDTRDVFVEVTDLDGKTDTYAIQPGNTVDQLITSVISCCNIPREKWSKIYLLKLSRTSTSSASASASWRGGPFLPGTLTVDQIQQDWLPLRAIYLDEKAI